MKTKISVAMTTYNGERYLSEQLNSIYSQTLLPNEVIVVDDCSTDGTKAILQEYHEKYGLQYFINEKNLGVNKNFEKAISLCTGDYIALSDQDDVWFPHKLETCYQKIISIEEDKPSMVSSNRLDVDGELKMIYKPRAVSDSGSFTTTLLGHNSQGCSIMMNKKLAEYFHIIPPEKEIMFDLYIGLTASMIGNKYYIAEPLFYYRHHVANVWGKFNTHKPTFYERLKERCKNRYPKLFKEERFHNMEVVARFQSDYFLPERKRMYYQLLSLNQSRNYFRKLGTILSIKEMSLKRRFLIVCDTLVSNILGQLITNKNVYENKTCS